MLPEGGDESHGPALNLEQRPGDGRGRCSRSRGSVGAEPEEREGRERSDRGEDSLAEAEGEPEHCQLPIRVTGEGVEDGRQHHRNGADGQRQDDVDPHPARVLGDEREPLGGPLWPGGIQGKTNGVFAAEAGHGLGRRAGEREDHEGRRRSDGVLTGAQGRAVPGRRQCGARLKRRTALTRG